MESAQHLKVNLKVAGQPCRACLRPLELAGEASLCTGCHSQHHRTCWETAGGCSTPGCVNAPLARLEPLPRMPAPGMQFCRNCRLEIHVSDLICPHCGVVTSPDGIYHGPKTNAPGAVASLVYALIGLFFCGVIFGPVAIAKASSAKRAMASNPAYGGGGLATAGMVIGIIDVALFVLFIVAKAGASQP